MFLFKLICCSNNKLFCAKSNLTLLSPRATAGRLSLPDVIVFGLWLFIIPLRFRTAAGLATRSKPATFLNLVAVVIVHHQFLSGLHNPGCFHKNRVRLKVRIPWGSPLGHYLVFQSAVPRLSGISAVDQPSWPAEKRQAQLIRPNRVGVQDPQFCLLPCTPFCRKGPSVLQEVRVFPEVVAVRMFGDAYSLCLRPPDTPIGNTIPFGQLSGRKQAQSFCFSCVPRLYTFPHAILYPVDSCCLRQPCICIEPHVLPVRVTKQTFYCHSAQLYSPGPKDTWI